jgi:hypothetical protein
MRELASLLFYHVRLHCYFLIELKVGQVKPEYAGKLKFYLSAADNSLRTASDVPTLGRSVETNSCHKHYAKPILRR